MYADRTVCCYMLMHMCEGLPIALAWSQIMGQPSRREQFLDSRKWSPICSVGYTNFMFRKSSVLFTGEISKAISISQRTGCLFHMYNYTECLPFYLECGKIITWNVSNIPSMTKDYKDKDRGLVVIMSNTVRYGLVPRLHPSSVGRKVWKNSHVRWIQW